MSTEKVLSRYFQQLVNGCGNSQCKNIYCRSSSSFMYEPAVFVDRNEAAAEAIRLSQGNAPLCIDENTHIANFEKLKISSLNENHLQEITIQCKKTNNWSILCQTMEITFSNRQNLLGSFLKEEFSKPVAIDKKISSRASAVSKYAFSRDSRITIDNDEITLDFDDLRRSIKLIKPYEDEICSTMHRSLTLLFKQLQYEFKSKKDDYENDLNNLNIFFIIFELPFLSDPSFVFDNAKLFYSILTNLSIEVQAKFVRILAKYTTNLKHYISHVQQYITLHTLRWTNHVTNSANNEELLSNEPGYRSLKLDSYSATYCFKSARGTSA